MRKTAKTAKREPYIKLNDSRYTWPDVLEMEPDELGRMLVDLDEIAESIESTLESLNGDSKVRAQDKMRYCRKWSARIRDEILGEVEEDPDDEPCSWDELVDENRQYRELLDDLTESVQKHLSPPLAEIVLSAIDAPE